MLRFTPDPLRAARLEADYSRFDVAKLADVSIDSVRRAEMGEGELGSLRLARIARVLGVTLDSLFVLHDREDGNPPSAAHGGNGAPQKTRPTPTAATR